MSARHYENGELVKDEVVLKFKDLIWKKSEPTRYIGYKKGEHPSGKYRMKNGSARCFDTDDYEHADLILRLKNKTYKCMDLDISILKIIKKELNRQKITDTFYNDLLFVFDDWKLTTTQDDIDYDISDIIEQIESKIRVAVHEGYLKVMKKRKS